MVRSTCTILTGKEVHEKLLEGSRKTANAVSTTFGPYGNNVAITMLYNLPHITKDGVTVSNSLTLEDQAEDVACQTIKRAAAKTAEIAGDGTTSTTILADALLKYCFELLEKFPERSNILKKQFLSLIPSLTEDIKLQSSKVSSKQDILNIAMVSSNGDIDISKLVTDAFDVIGKDGLVTVMESRSYNTHIETTQGIKLDRGYISPMLETGKTKNTYDNPRILVTDLDFTSIQDAIHILELQSCINTPLLVICNDLIGSALNVIAHNKLKNSIPIEFIRAPHIADARREAVKDLAIVTGGIAVLKDQGWNIESISSESLGYADSFEISLKETNIIGRKGNEGLIKERITYYDDKISSDTDGLKENYKKRLAYFTSGASVIYVGGSNEIEVQEKKDRFDDTIRAVKAAMEEGIVLGGCITYLNMLDNTANFSNEAAWQILKKAIHEMIAIFFINQGKTYNEENIKNLRKQVETDNIYDPALVVKSTIINAIGAAIMIFTTNCIVIKHDPA